LDLIAELWILELTFERLLLVGWNWLQENTFFLGLRNYVGVYVGVIIIQHFGIHLLDCLE
jgi:hypothetical protein